MNWENLKKYKCPSCGGQLYEHKITNDHQCGNCSFTIRDSKYSEILRSKPKRQKTEEENLSELNNMKVKELREKCSAEGGGGGAGF